MSAASMAGVQRSSASTSRLMSLSDLMAISSKVGRDSLGEAPKRFFRVLAEEFHRIALAALVAHGNEYRKKKHRHPETYPEEPLRYARFHRDLNGGARRRRHSHNFHGFAAGRGGYA